MQRADGTVIHAAKKDTHRLFMKEFTNDPTGT